MCILLFWEKISKTYFHIFFIRFLTVCFDILGTSISNHNLTITSDTSELIIVAIA